MISVISVSAIVSWKTRFRGLPSDGKVCGMRNTEEHRVWSGLNQEKDSHGILFTPVDIGGRPLSYSVTSPAPDVRS